MPPFDTTALLLQVTYNKGFPWFPASYYSFLPFFIAGLLNISAYGYLAYKAGLPLWQQIVSVASPLLVIVGAIDEGKDTYCLHALCLWYLAQ